MYVVGAFELKRAPVCCVEETVGDHGKKDLRLSSLDVNGSWDEKYDFLRYRGHNRVSFCKYLTAAVKVRSWTCGGGGPFLEVKMHPMQRPPGSNLAHGRRENALRLITRLEIVQRMVNPASLSPFFVLQRFPSRRRFRFTFRYQKVHVPKGLSSNMTN